MAGLGVTGDVGQGFSRNLTEILRLVWPKHVLLFALDAKINLDQGIDPKVLDQPGDGRLVLPQGRLLPRARRPQLAQLETWLG